MRSSHARQAALRMPHDMARGVRFGIAGCLCILICVAQGSGCGGSASSVKAPSGDAHRRPAGPAATADTLPAPNLKVEVADDEKAALAAQARGDLEQVTAMMGKLDRQHMAAEALEKLKTVESLITAAESAGEKGDVTAMANLARKARLLTAELLPQ